MNSALNILTDDERRIVETEPETGFITRFREWAEQRTDAPGFALESAALVALSMAAGDTVVLPDLFSNGPSYMNIYVLMVGPSTTMRKTTVLNYVMSLLPRNQQTKKRYIKTIDDTSPQAFNKALAEAGKNMAPVILNMDEIAGVFQVSRRKNSYANNFDSLLLKAYDHSPVVINRTGGDIEVERGAFTNLFAASTAEPLMEILDVDDVETGLLPRFLIFDLRDAIGGERRSLMSRMEIADEWGEEKERLADFLYRIAKDRADGVPIGTDADGTSTYKVTTLKVDIEALKRLDAIDALFHRSRRDDTTALGAIKGRALWQIYKLAGLYALSRSGIEGQIELLDVLRAAHLIEVVAGDLAKLHEEVGANQLERRIKEVQDLIDASPNRRVRQANVLNRLSLSYSESMDLMKTMVARELIKFDDIDNNRYWRKP